MLSYFLLLNLYSKDLEIEIFLNGNTNDLDIIEFPNNGNYRHVKNSANWQDSNGNYGVLECLLNISAEANNKNTKLKVLVIEKVKIMKSSG